MFSIIALGVDIYNNINSIQVWILNRLTKQ